MSLEEVSRLIQLSLTPVFLLSAIAALLGVFATRLSRLDDRVHELTEEMETASPDAKERLRIEQAYHRARTRVLDVAVVLGALAGTLTCATVLTLLVGALTGLKIAVALFTAFGGAVTAAIGALLAFGYEMLLASRGLRTRSRKAMERHRSG